MVFLSLLLLTATVKGESGGGNDTRNDTRNDTIIEEEECQDYDISWFIQQYSQRILTKPYLSIGVNISLPKAASTKHWEFRALLRNAHLRKLPPNEVCNEHIPSHAQQFQQACGWSYRCDYNPHRFPAYVFQAHCTNDLWGPSGSSEASFCQRVFYPVPMLYSSGCNPLTSKKNWTWKQEMVSVACA